MAGIRIEGASKRFGPVQALGQVSLSAEAGEFVVLLGPSGSGKTTLLRSIAGLEPLDSGRIWLGERLVEEGGRVRLPPEARGLGMVFQEYALWPHLSALENVALPLRERRLEGWKARALEAMDGVGLAAHTQRFPYELSGGQQQRVALARALAGRPQVLLFDEPLSNLDAQLREELRLEIARLTRAYGITAVYITHDQAEAFFLADRLGVMRGGELVQFDRPEQVFQAPANPFVARFTGAVGEFEAQLEGSSLTFLPSPGLRLRLNTPPCAPGRVRVLLRPEAVRLHLTPLENALPAKAVHSAYGGGGYQCWLEVAGQRLLARSAQRLRPGESVWLSLEAEQLLVFPEEASEPIIRGKP